MVGIAFVALGIAVKVHGGRRAGARTARAQATITGFHIRHMSSAGGWFKTIRHPVLRLIGEDGASHEVISEVGLDDEQWKTLSVGDEVEVNYNPDDPDNCLMTAAAPEGMGLPSLLFGFGAAMLVLAAGLLTIGSLMPASQ